MSLKKTPLASVSGGSRRSHDAPVCVVPPIFEPVLARLQAEAAPLFGFAPVELMPVTYEERRFSHLLRMAVCEPTDARPRSHIFVKVFKSRAEDPDSALIRRRVTHDFDTTLHTHQAMSALEDLGAVRPIVSYPEHLASVTEQAAGQTLLEHLESSAAWHPGQRTMASLLAVMAQTGRWVRTYQSLGAAPSVLSIAELRDYVDVRLQRLVDTPLAVFLECDRQRVLEHIDALGALVMPEDLVQVTVHADLAPGNVLISGTRVVVLDFAMSTRGSMFLDLSRLWMQVGLLTAKPQFRPRVIGRLQDALLHGFDPCLEAGRAMFRLLLLQHRINHLSTLVLRRERGIARLYSTLVRRSHRRWLERELESSRRALAGVR